MRENVKTEFNSLEIKRIQYGPDVGKILATLKITGKSADITVYIQDEAATKIMEACSLIVAESAAEKAKEFQKEFLDAIRGKADQ